MPAGSDAAGEPAAPSGSVPLPRSWRPLGPRIAAVLFGGALLVVCVFAWFTFDAETRARFTLFQRATLLAFGALAFGLMHALARSRVVAEDERLVVVNGYRRHDYAWAQVIGVHLPPGAPWVTLDLADGTTRSAMGIQGSDGDRAKRAVRELRAVLAAKH